jgi:hypothetical protein
MTSGGREFTLSAVLTEIYKKKNPKSNGPPPANSYAQR